MKTYLVGGAVRDSLLGIPGSDQDFVVTGATIREMLDLGFQQVGKSFPVFLHPQTKCEYALARTERKDGHGYTGFCFDFSPEITLEEDLKRRDLTINAMAQDENGTIIDPWGGREDLQNRIIRHVSDSFGEDPLRVLRTARFAARFAPLGFTVAPETLKLMREITASGELQYLTPERIFREFEKVLQEGWIDVFIKVLRECSALKILFPEMDNLYGIPARKYWHPEVDTGIHMELALHYASTHNFTPVEKAAVFCHDFGKALSDPALLPSHHGHGRKGIALIRQFAQRLKIPNEYRDAAILVAGEHSFVHTALNRTPGELLDLLHRIDAFRRPEHLTILMNCALADIRGRQGFENIQYCHADLIRDLFGKMQLITSKQVAADGFTGQGISQELYKRRLTAAEEFKKNWIKEHAEEVENERKEDPDSKRK